MRLYVHGAGRSGRQAWPEQDETQAVFADHSVHSDMQAKVDAIVEQAPAGPAVVVAHSLGAVVAALAATADRLAVSHFVLVEPALYDLARGEHAIEAHIEAMTTARKLAHEGDLYGYWQIISPLMFEDAASPDRWVRERVVAERFAALPVPWGHAVTVATFAQTPTLVVTGGWNDEYEQIAARLSAAGAEHLQLPGLGHRPQDHPQFNSLVSSFAHD